MFHRHLIALLVPPLMSSCAAVSNTSTFVYTRPLALSQDGEKLAAMEQGCLTIYMIRTATVLSRTCDVQSDRHAAISLDFNWAISVPYQAELVDLRTPDHPKKSLWVGESGINSRPGIVSGDLYFGEGDLCIRTQQKIKCDSFGRVKGAAPSPNGGHDLITSSDTVVSAHHIDNDEVKQTWEQPGTFLDMVPGRVALMSTSRLFIVTDKGEVLHTFQADPGESFTGQGDSFLKFVDQNTVLYFKSQDKKLDVCTFNVQSQKSNCVPQTQVKAIPEPRDAVVSPKSKQLFLPNSTVLNFSLPE